MKRQILRKASLLLTLCMIAAMLIACSGEAQSTVESSLAGSTATSGSNTASGEPIKIGFIAVMAGTDAYVGQSAYLAAQDYAAELTAKGGILGRPVELIGYDISVDFSEGVNATNRLIQQDKVCAIIGPDGSDYAMPLAAIGEAAQVPLVCTAATNERVTVNEDGSVKPYMFRVCFPDSYQGKALAQYAYNKMGLRKVANLTCVTAAYSKGLVKIFSEEFIKLGGTITAEEGFQITDTEFRSQLTKIHDSGAEAVFNPTGEYRHAALMAKQAADLGYEDMGFLGTDGWYAESLLENAGAELEGAVITNGIVEDDPRFSDFRNAFNAKHGMMPNMFAYYTLDAFMTIEAAIKKGNSASGKDIRDNLENLSDIDVFSGKLTIEPDTHNPHNKEVAILKITNSKFVLVESYKPQ